MAVVVSSYTGKINPDFLTEGWTKKDWALNLLPLGGVASVAYEMGSACLCSRDQTAKISQDFFKSPAQTIHKKVAQCLWVPIVICGALKLISLIVTACWNRCFPPANDEPSIKIQVPEPVSEDSSERVLPEPLPDDVFLKIFSYLDMRALATTRCVCTAWKTFAETPTFWKKAIYEEFAFSSKDWALWDQEIVHGVDFSQEHLTLPEDIVEQLKLSHTAFSQAFPRKSIMQTHVLVRMPAGLTINKLDELLEKHFPNRHEGRLIKTLPMANIEEMAARNVIADRSENAPVWLLMTRDVIAGSQYIRFEEQQAIVAQLGQRHPLGYKVPTALEAVTCFVADYLKPNYNTGRVYLELRVYTACEDIFRGSPVVVSGSRRSDPSFFFYYSAGDVGVVVLRRFEGH